MNDGNYAPHNFSCYFDITVTDSHNVVILDSYNVVISLLFALIKNKLIRNGRKCCQVIFLKESAGLLIRRAVLFALISV